MRRLNIARESWPIAGTFTISRGSRTSVEVITVRLEQDGAVGHGEGVPYARYGETVDGTVAALEAARGVIEAGLERNHVADAIGPMAARNALDCALWDLEAKRTGIPVWQLAGLDRPRDLVTAYTLSLGTADAMAEAAAKASHRPLLKIKLGSRDDAEKLRAVRRNAPNSRLIVDANEGWRPVELPDMLAVCAETGVELVEQPLPADNDAALLGLQRNVIVCADESAHGRNTLAGFAGKYDAINIKLDKTGGLTEALALAEAARAAGLEIMVGCMLATSLSMAPAMLVAANARVVDLDGPLLLARDREPGIAYDGSIMHPAPASLWG